MLVRSVNLPPGVSESINVLDVFFEQKTAYDMRISDWSSDVCSSDLPAGDRSAPDGRAGGAGGDRVPARGHQRGAGRRRRPGAAVQRALAPTRAIGRAHV